MFQVRKFIVTNSLVVKVIPQHAALILFWWGGGGGGGLYLTLRAKIHLCAAHQVVGCRLRTINIWKQNSSSARAPPASCLPTYVYEYLNFSFYFQHTKLLFILYSCEWQKLKVWRKFEPGGKNWAAVTCVHPFLGLGKLKRSIYPFLHLCKYHQEKTFGYSVYL